MSFTRPPTIQTRPRAVCCPSNTFHGDGRVARAAQLQQNLIDDFAIDTRVNRPTQPGGRFRHDRWPDVALSIALMGLVFENR